jgi:hypothetical protein
MNYSVIWNEICYHLSKNRSASERDFQTTVEFLFEKLGWSQYNGEIVSNKAIPIGSANSVKPDIIIKLNEQIVLAVEVKKPNTVISERNADQLRSYMRLLRLNFGVLLGETLQLYHELTNDNNPPIQVNDIPFVKDLKEGAEFIKLLSKDEFSFDRLQKYCDKKLADAEKIEICDKYVAKLCALEGAEFVRESIKDKLLKEFSEEIVSSIINKISIHISLKEKSDSEPLQRNTHSLIRSVALQNDTTENRMSKSDAKNICFKSGLNLNGITTFSTKNRTTNCYWANPKINVLSQNWWLLMNDFNKNKLHVFNIPANSIKESQVKVRSDNEHLIDLQIQYDDNSFEDNRSKIRFAKWLIKTISY